MMVAVSAAACVFAFLGAFLGSWAAIRSLVHPAVLETPDRQVKTRENETARLKAKFDRTRRGNET